MQFITLSDKFYSLYSQYPEILKKRNRPYACIEVLINGVKFAVPLRHHISHKYSFITKADYGLDYTKTVVIEDDSYIGETGVQINQEEFKAISGRETFIRNQLIKYIRIYKKSCKYTDNVHYKSIRQYSTLQYFEKYIDNL